MISTAMVPIQTCYYPLGNTPAVSLTQDLPPNQDADILLLGCGDVRKVLFTCFADATRKIDVTCCDIEPVILARNVLLYSLLIDDETNLNIDRIWNIYFHWKLDKKSLELLETQVQKLMRVSNSIDEWHASVYGVSIRFCGAKSLSCVRACWAGFQLRDLPHAEKIDRVSQMQDLIDNSKAFRLSAFGTMEPFPLDGLSCAHPVGFNALQDLAKVGRLWYETGTTPSSSSALKSTELNPAFLYSPNPAVFLSHDINPLVGFPLSIAFTPVTPAFSTKCENVSSTEHLVNCVKALFAQWASAFRNAVANKSVIRIFCGDALDFCLTLRSRQLYNGDVEKTPLTFDTIDTSNLIDTLGATLIVAASMVLKCSAQSSLYTDTLTLWDSDCAERLFGVFGVDASSMALLLGLVLPAMFTNAKNSIEQSPVGKGVTAWSRQGQPNEARDFYFSRWCWKRSLEFKESNVFIEAEALGSFLTQVYDVMFKNEDLDLMADIVNNPSTSPREHMKLCVGRYNRASFACLLHCLQTTVVTDWNRCVDYIYEKILSTATPGSLRLEYMQDLSLNLHLFGIDSRRLIKPSPAAVSAAILAPRLPRIEDMPVQLCVTVKVSREDIDCFFVEHLNNREKSPAFLFCSFEGGDERWSHTFSTVRVAFGTWHMESKDGESRPFIDEDPSQMYGVSDMFVSVMVPMAMLLQAKRCAPAVAVGIILTPESWEVFGDEDLDDIYITSHLMNTENVFITRCMPGMSTLPGFPPTTPQRDKSASAGITVRLTRDGSKIDTLVRRITLESQQAKDELADRATSVNIEFKSPLIASVLIAQSRELKFEFPVPVSPSKYKLRIARKSSYVEVEAPLFDPLKETVPFTFPTFCTKTPSGTIISIPWASTYVNLDVMPLLDLKNTHSMLWLVEHASLMFSERERRIHKSSMANRTLCKTELDTQTSLKDSIFSILMLYTGLRGQQTECFGLTTTDGGIKFLILPSCLRLDLVNHTVVLDAAMIPMTSVVSSDPRAVQFLQELTDNGLCQLKVSESENFAWEAMMPALVERCRITWEHTQDCEYAKEGKAPIFKGLSDEGISTICSCGIGQFPPGDYLKCQTERLPDLNYVVNRYATRIALAPIFAVPEVEDCTFSDFAEKLGFPTHLNIYREVTVKLKNYFAGLGIFNKEKCVFQEKCGKCGKRKRENVESNEEKLLHCAKCKMVRYCSRDCQVADWSKHKPLCSAS